MTKRLALTHAVVRLHLLQVSLGRGATEQEQVALNTAQVTGKANSYA